MENFRTLEQIVTGYLDSLGMNMSSHVYDTVCQCLADGRKVDAVKFLRTETAVAEYAQVVVPDTAMGHRFHNWMHETGNTTYEKRVVHCLGLKEAKDIVDVIQANM